MSDDKPDMKSVASDMLADTWHDLFRFLRRCAVYAAVGAVLMGGVTYALIGELWFGLKIGALLGVMAGIGIRYLFYPSFFD